MLYTTSGLVEIIHKMSDLGRAYPASCVGCVILEEH